jgi:DUF4097 and DUF4098 domain-containing protein YvlB
MTRTSTLISATALAGLLAGMPALAQEPAQDSPRSDQTVPVTRGARLMIENFAGEVVIHTWDKDQLRVQARHSTQTRVNVRSSETGVLVKASSRGGPSGAVDYDITAPSWMPVKVEGTFIFVMVDGAQSEVSAETNRGDIVVKGGSGYVTARSVQGEVIVDGARGRVNVSSVNEGIKITGASGEIVAETTNGSISLSKIDSKNVDVSTVNGNITCDGGLADGARYSLVTHNGDITMTVPESAGATFTVRTYNGEFHAGGLPLKATEEVRRGKRAIYSMGNGSAQVNLESFGGTIRLRRPSGAGRSKEP